jgi:CRP/FNR family cyclic AMP-dependent transcriptional regulator
MEVIGVMNILSLASNQAKILEDWMHLPKPRNRRKTDPGYTSVSYAPRVLSENHIAELVKDAKRIRYPKHAVICSEGDVADSFYIILSGKVRVFSSDENCKEFTLQIYNSGDYFGEIALLTGGIRSASVETLEPTICAMIPKTRFLQWLSENHDIMFGLMGQLSSKITQLTVKLRQMALSNVYERTIQALEDMAVVEDGVKAIHKKPTQNELACMVGASREMIGKIMQDLIKGGYLEQDKKLLIFKKKLPASW